MKQVKFSANIPVSFFKEGDAYIAYCPILDLSTSASTFKKVKERFSEVIEVFFEELVDMGTLDEVLANLGWTKVQHHWTPPFSVGHDLQRVTIPLSA
jgi:predicted RNase H-like HicB family nuclease